MAEVIRNSGEALVVVINDILDFSKIESGGMELESAPFDLRACIEDCLQLFAAQAGKKNLHLVYDLPPTCPAIIHGDSTRFRQVLCNLIGNAVKFTADGEVEVRLRPLTPTTGETFTLAVEVRDTGIGIPADRLDRLFKSFSQVDSSMTRKYGGTGLGLAISRRLAELMGGTITVASEAGKGSTFTFLLTTQAEPATATSVFAPRASLQGVRVLLVENHPATATFIESYLRLWGLDCTVVPDATQALRQVRDFGPWPLLITALQLPGTDGLALCRSIPTTKTILLSSLIREDLLSEAKALGIADVLAKPLRPATLLQAIEATLAGPAPVSNIAASPAPAALFAHERPLRILVAEDNQVNQLVAHHTFARLGYEITLANDGEQAVAAAQATALDVIFMDVQMPNMNGYEATQRIRAFPPGARRPWIIALTASVLEGDRELCLRHGMDDFLPKPIRFADLERVLRAVPAI
jgi:CheY-like chemotaxis protein